MSDLDSLLAPEKCAELLRGNGRYWFVCSDCGEIFEDANAIIKHVDIHFETPNSELPIKVKLEVNESAILTEFLTTIKGEYHAKPEEIFVDDGQPSDFLQYEKFQPSLDHLRNTSDNGEYEEIEVRLKKCRLCGEIFDTRELLSEHMVHSHDVVKRTFECEQCTKVFVGPTTFERHFKKVHMNGQWEKVDDRPYRCDLCQKTFNEFKSIKFHIGTVHADDEILEFTCQYCGTLFSRLGRLETHLQTAHADILQKKGIKPTKAKPFSCDVCSKGFTLKNSLRNHLAVIHSRSDLLEQSFKCEHCGKLFAIRSRLEFHMQRAHASTIPLQPMRKRILVKKERKDSRRYRPPVATIQKSTTNTANEKAKPYNCDVCGRAFSLRNSLKNHLAVVHSRGDLLKNSFKCRLCDKMFAILSRLEHHMEKKHEIREKLSCSRTFRCAQCDITLSSRSAMRQHHIDTHTVETFKSWKCEMCDRVFSKKRMLESHINEHKNLREHKCKICGTGFNNAYKVKSHMLTHNERTYKCDLCDFAAKTQRTLDSHRQNIHDEIEHRFVCELCAKSFKYKITYDCHMRRHNGEKPYQCFICGKAYYTSGNLNTHVKHAHSTRTYNCGLCDKLFHSELRLKIHMKTHATELRYACIVCGKKFKTDKTLRQHKLIHDTMKRYKCNYCDMRFTQSSGRRGHERLRHFLA